MEKKKLFGKALKKQLRARARDRQYNFFLADGSIRGVIVNGTQMINEMRANHALGILETLVLGRAYLGVCLMAADLKGQDRIRMRIDCEGPIRGLVAEANAYGEVRGYLKQVPIFIEKPLKDFDLSAFFGEGILAVTKHLQDSRQPFTGQVRLKYGNLALDLANYYLESEQVPTAFNLGIKYDQNGEVTGAGGLFLQAMPGLDDQMTGDLEERVNRLPSLGVAFSDEDNPKDIIQAAFGPYSPRFLAERRIEFMCHCSKERFRNYLSLLSPDEMHDILEKGPYPLETRCHFCNTTYAYEKHDLEQIFRERQEA
jgi:molecular chaperone Hsp33